jgi:hypothetical protein
LDRPEIDAVGEEPAGALVAQIVPVQVDLPELLAIDTCTRLCARRVVPVGEQQENLLVEVGQVVLKRPLFDLPRVAVGVAVVVVPLTIARVQPLLVLALELVVRTTRSMRAARSASLSASRR